MADAAADTRATTEPNRAASSAAPAPGKAQLTAPVKARPQAGAPKRRRRSGRKWFLFLLVLIALGGVAAWYRYAPRQSEEQSFITAPVRTGDVENSVSALGSLQPVNYVDVGAQVSGQLKVLHVAIGDHVKQGDLIAEIDPALYLNQIEGDRADIANLQAQLADKQAQLVLTQQQAERQRGLAKIKATSEENLQTAEAALQSAQANVDSLKAQIEKAQATLKGVQVNLGYTKIYAPITGTVVSQSANQGQTLNANQSAPTIVRVSDLSTMTVQAQVSEADVSKLHVGMDAYFTTLGRPEKRYYGKLRQIQPTPEETNNVILYYALFDVPNPAGQLMTQMSAEVFFVVEAARNVPLVPVAALQPAGRGEGGRDRGTGEHRHDGGGNGDGQHRRRDAGGNAPAGQNQAGQNQVGQNPAGQGQAGQGQPAAPAQSGGPGSIGDSAPAGAAPAQGAAAQPEDNSGKPKRYRVRVLTSSGSVEDRNVEIGAMDRVDAQALSGLSVGDQVITGSRQPKPATAATGNQRRGPGGPPPML
ncbi:membrane fusion protein, macrolide-specific efflux system [Faunimonas pinastri]|uniref:Membrane fusion protein, macrolide-specific efflux system n=1 Tax=Faunimonas pinastri TaxID=1855383 RepID=A0A1H9B092_9HYPH|nr:efflux RND transporter periplasmic adaptor subunit [Faunimonas pinastri]SEP82157.1 membrane fusion protein, macrolide-specific efflux system [Faunimonas pinastri]